MPSDKRILRRVVVASLLPPLAGIVALAVWASPHYWRHVTAVTWYAVLVTLALEWAIRRGRRTGPFLALAALNLALLTPEICLRLAGFRYETGVSFGYPRPDHFRRFEQHEVLFWTLPPGSPGVNAHGFRAPELPRTAAEDTAQIVILGDSVAHQGYPDIVEILLNGRPGGRRAEVINLSLPGYSSHQGRALVGHLGGLIEPDVAVVAYGWNDHWLAWGAIDSERVTRIDRSWSKRAAGAVYRRSRLLQAARRLSDSLSGTALPLAEPRVPLDQYRENLTWLGETLSGRGAVPLLLTSPTSHVRLGAPAFLEAWRFASDLGSAAALHRAYNRTVREVAARGGWPLLDLEREIETRDDLEAIFLEDGIHLTAEGQALLAQRVAAAIDGLLEPATPLAGDHSR